MRGYVVLVGLVASSTTLGCAPTVNVEQERATLLAVDQEWSQSANDIEKFASYFAPDASAYPQGMPIVQGSAAIKETFAQMSAAPGFSLAWTPAKAEVGAGGDVGYTAGAYNMSMAV